MQNHFAASVPAGRLLKIAAKLHEGHHFEVMVKKLAEALDVQFESDDCTRLGYEGTYLEMFFAWERKRRLDQPATQELSDILKRMDLLDLAKELCE